MVKSKKNKWNFALKVNDNLDLIKFIKGTWNVKNCQCGYNIG